MMRSSHAWIDHTGELELSLEGESLEAVFVEGALALGSLLGEREPQPPAAAGEVVRHELSASAPDRATLLAEWLSELVYHAEVEGLIPLGVERIAVAGTELEATVAARAGSPSHLVKAVTYHRLELVSVDGGWRARVVLDV